MKTVKVNVYYDNENGFITPRRGGDSVTKNSRLVPCVATVRPIKKAKKGAKKQCNK